MIGEFPQFPDASSGTRPMTPERLAEINRQRHGVAVTDIRKLAREVAQRTTGDPEAIPGPVLILPYRQADKSDIYGPGIQYAVFVPIGSDAELLHPQAVEPVPWEEAVGVVESRYFRGQNLPADLHMSTELFTAHQDLWFRHHQLLGDVDSFEKALPHYREAIGHFQL